METSPDREHRADAAFDSRARAPLLLELVVLFVALPAVLVGLDEGGVRAPILPTLAAITLCVVFAMRRVAPGALGEAVRAPVERRELVRVLGLASVGVLLLVLFISQATPERLLHLPRTRPALWGVILFLYPVLSVVPQEILYRVFLFRRYRTLLASAGSRVASSAVLFGFAHVIYGNWIAVMLSVLGGVLFGWTYERTGSLRLVALEHALYGAAVFTLGLGPYFYDRVSLFAP